MKRGLLSRELVLERALELAQKDGLSQITYNGLAREIGVAPQSLYRYVTNLDDVRAGIVTNYVQKLTAFLKAETEKKTGKEALIRFGTAFMEFTATTISFADMVWGFAAYGEEETVAAALEGLHGLASTLVRAVLKKQDDEKLLCAREMLFVEYVIGHLGLTYSKRGELPDQFVKNLSQLVDWLSEE